MNSNNPKIIKSVFVRKYLILFFNLFYFNAQATAMSLINKCSTDKDCPPSWDENAIFCNTPIYNDNSSSKRKKKVIRKYNKRNDSSNDIIVYDGSEVVKIDPEKVETLSQSYYNPVCVSYRPMGYPCKTRTDCLANKNVDLPFIQCVDSKCTDLGKTTGNYVKNNQGNHNNNPKSWYVGLGFGIVAIILILGLISIMLYSKKKRKEELKMEDKIKKQNAIDICNDDEEEDKGNVTCIGEDMYDYINYSKRSDHDENGTMINTNMNNHTKLYKKEYNKQPIKISSINKDKKSKKSKLSILSRLFGRSSRSSTKSSIKHSSTINDVEIDDTTLGRYETEEIGKVKKETDIGEIDMTNGLKSKDVLKLYDDVVSLEKSNNEELKKLRHSKSGNSITEHRFTFDPERTLVRNLRKSSSKATMGSVVSGSSTQIYYDEKSYTSNRNILDQSERQSTYNLSIHDNILPKKILPDIQRESIYSSSINNNVENEEKIPIQNYKSNNSYIQSSNYNPLILNSIHSDINHENENTSANSLDNENNINKAMLKRLNNKISNQNDSVICINDDKIDSKEYKSVLNTQHQNSNNLNTCMPNSNKESINENIKNSNSHTVNESSINNNGNLSSTNNKYIYPTPKQNPNKITETIINHHSSQLSNTPISTPDLTARTRNNNNNNSPSVYEGYDGSIYDFYQEGSENNNNQLKNSPYSIPHNPISEVVESTFGSSNSLSVSLESDQITDNETKENTKYAYDKNYSIPTPFDSPYEKAQQPKENSKERPKSITSIRSSKSKNSHEDNRIILSNNLNEKPSSSIINQQLPLSLQTHYNNPQNIDYTNINSSIDVTNNNSSNSNSISNSINSSTYPYVNLISNQNEVVNMNPSIQRIIMNNRNYVQQQQQLQQQIKESQFINEKVILPQSTNSPIYSGNYSNPVFQNTSMTNQPQFISSIKNSMKNSYLINSQSSLDEQNIQHYH